MHFADQRRRNVKVRAGEERAPPEPCAKAGKAGNHQAGADPDFIQPAGSGAQQAFRLILLPLSVPILAVVFILAFIGSITEVPMASILLQDVNNLTLAVGAQQYLYPQNYLWGDFAAAAVLSGFPITVVFLLAQRWLVGGLTAGGVKG